jgi:hypothetical protein
MLAGSSPFLSQFLDLQNRFKLADDHRQKIVDVFTRYHQIVKKAESLILSVSGDGIQHFENIGFQVSGNPGL